MGAYNTNGGPVLTLQPFNLHALSFPILRRKLLIYGGAVAIFFVIVAAAGVGLFFSPVLTHYIESDGFRQTMENETAKGLHFPSGQYARIRRTGPVMAQSEGFQSSDGEKAMKSIDAYGITAKV